MKKFLQNSSSWLLPVFLIIFILEVIAFPFAVGMTYAGRSEAPEHILTYTEGRLEWSQVKGIDKNGAAIFSLFDAEYENVKSENGVSVIAPGTEGLNIVRFKNNSPKTVSYKAVLYAVKSNDSLPVEVSLLGDGLVDTDEYILPKGVSDNDIVRAVGGDISVGQIVDFDISWLWSYEINDENDLIDIDFGNKSAEGNPDDITVGFYLIVNDNNETYSPDTGDNSGVILYSTVVLVSAVILIVLVIFRRRERIAE